MDSQKISTVRKIVWVSLNFTTGLTDLIVVVRKPDGSLLSPAPTVVEQGLGIYTAEYTPDTLGIWQEKVSSILNGDLAIRSYEVVAVDLSDIKAEADVIAADVIAVKAEQVIQGGKLDTISTQVAGISTEIKPGGYFA